MLIPDRKMLVLTKEVIRDCHQCHSTLSALDSKCLRTIISFCGTTLLISFFSSGANPQNRSWNFPWISKSWDNCGSSSTLGVVKQVNRPNFWASGSIGTGMTTFLPSKKCWLMLVLHSSHPNFTSGTFNSLQLMLNLLLSCPLEPPEVILKNLEHVLLVW